MKLPVITFIIGVVAAVLFMRSCNEQPKPEIRTEIRVDTVFENIYIPVVKGEAKSVLKYTYGGMVHDTILERIYITTGRGDTVKEFTATLDTIQNKDTLHLEYSYPSSIFKYSLSRQPIEIKYVNTTVTNTVTLPEKRFTYGLQAGYGYLVSFRTGQSAMGAYFGFGVGYKL